jgi:hypothetical protein
MISLLAALAALAGPPTARVEVSARASITIVRGQPISERSWDPRKQPSQREILTKDADGRQQLLRLTEFQ